VQSFYTFIALDVARQKAAEAERRSFLLGDGFAADARHSDRSIRRATARLIATVSRTSGRVARRLDDNVNVTGAIIGRSIASSDGCIESRT